MTGFLAAVRSLFGGRASEPLMNPTEFTEEVARRVRAAAPTLDVQVAGELELGIDMTDDGGNRAFLNNAYQMYQRAIAAI
jgi:hypothetical protein